MAGLIQIILIRLKDYDAYDHPTLEIIEKKDNPDDIFDVTGKMRPDTNMIHNIQNTECSVYHLNFCRKQGSWTTQSSQSKTLP